MRKGFTLVELSIVLVIIGLLTGGILIGQSLIAAVELSSFTRQMQQYDASLALFRDRFRALPGDTNLFSYPGSHGGARANNLWIKDSYNNDDFFTGETAHYWEDLSLSGFLEEEYTNAGGGMVAGVNFPTSELGDDTGIVVGLPWNKRDPFTGNNEGDPTIIMEPANVYWISNFPDNGTHTWGGICSQCRYAFTPEQALSVDQKMDDGLQNTGDVRGAGSTEFGPPSTNCVTGSSYDVDRDDLVCSLIIRTLSQVGQ